MADEVIVETGAVETSQVDSVDNGQSSTETETQQSTNEHMIPKSRFDEVNSKLKELQTAQEQANKAREEAENEKLAEQNQWKELYEKEQAEKLAAEEKYQSAVISNLKQSIGSELGLPAALISRLVGTTDEEIREDAKTLLEGLPKPTAPNVGNTTGNGNAPANGAMSDVEKANLAAQLGVLPQYIQ